MPRLPAGLLPQAARPDPTRRPEAEVATDDRRHHPLRPRLPRHRDRRPLARRSCASWCPTGAPSSSSPRPSTSSSGRSRRSASASASPRRWATPSSPHLAAKVAPGHRRRLPRHRLPLRRDHRHPRRRRGDPAGQPDHDHARADGGRAGRDLRQGPLQDRPRPVLQAAQGPAAGRLAGAVRRVGDRTAPRRDPQPRDRAGHRLGRQEAQGQGLPARALDRRAGRALRRRATASW